MSVFGDRSGHQKSMTRGTIGEQAIQRITNSLRTSTLNSGVFTRTRRLIANKYKYNTALLPTGTSWNDLPMEILVLIAKQTIVPQESTATDQYPHLDDIDTTFGKIDRRARRAFFDAVQQDCIFINLQYQNRRLSRTYSNFKLAIKNYFPSQKASSLLRTSRLSGHINSLVHMQFHERLQSSPKNAGDVVFIGTPWNITLMQSFLVSQRGLYRNLIIDCHSSSPSADQYIFSFPRLIENITRDMDFAGVFTSPPDIMPLTQSSLLSTYMMRPSDNTTNLAIHENHLQWIQQAIPYKPLQAILPYAAEAALDHIRLFGPINILFHSSNIRLAHQRTLYITLVLKFFSSYLLLQPNTRASQFHCLFINDSHGDVLLRECLKATNTARETLEEHRWVYYRTEVEIVFRAVFSMLQARAEYELALARTSTLPRASKLSTHVQRSENHELGELNFEEHIRLSREMRLTTLWIFHARLTLKKEAGLAGEITLFLKWYDMIRSLTYELETARVRSVNERVRDGVLVDPVQQDRVESLQIVWVSPEDA